MFHSTILLEIFTFQNLLENFNFYQISLPDLSQ